MIVDTDSTHDSNQKGKEFYLLCLVKPLQYSSYLSERACSKEDMVPFTFSSHYTNVVFGMLSNFSFQLQYKTAH